MDEAITSDAIQKIEEHLPDGSDPTVLVLKAHLLVEEQMVQILQQISIRPERIEHARLTFPQKIEILRSFLPIQVPEQWFQAALLLNTIRNRLAHQLAPKDLHSLDRDFLNLMISASKNLAGFLNSQDQSDLERYRAALAMLVIVLSASRVAIPEILAARAHRNDAA